MEQYLNVTVVPVASRLVTDLTPVTMIEAQFTPTKEAMVRHHVCPICHFTYPETEMSLVSGQWYCIKLKHDQDKLKDLTPRTRVVSE